MRKDLPQLIEVDPMRITFNPHNPRKHEGRKYDQLKQSVQEVDTVQYPTVRVRPGGFYECIDGEGRVKAKQEVGAKRMYVVSLGIVDDQDALTMLQAANTVREFSYLAKCKGLANLHRQGQTREQIAKSIGVGIHSVQIDISVGYFPEQTLALIQNDVLQSSEGGPHSESSEEDRQERHRFSWSATTFVPLLPLRIQLKPIQAGEKGIAAPLDGVYDYTEVHRAVEKIVHGEIATHEQLQSYVERRQRELFEEHFDKALQIRLDTELEQAKQALKEAQEVNIQQAEQKTAQRYASQVSELQHQLDDLDKRNKEIVKDAAKHPERVAELEAKLEQQRQKVEKERIQLQEEKQKLRQQLEQEFHDKEEAMWEKRRAEREQERAEWEQERDKKQAEMDKKLKQAESKLEAYYADRDQKRQVKVEKTFRHAIAHGIELLAQTHEWILLLLTPEMRTGLPSLQDSELVSLVAQIRTVRNTLEKAEEVILHGGVADATPAEEGGSNVDDDSIRDDAPPKNLGYG